METATPPPLPAALANPGPVIFIGTIIWLVLGVALVLLRPLDVWTWTCLAGGALGLLGSAIMAWQRRAARRGARGAQQGLN